MNQLEAVICDVRKWKIFNDISILHTTELQKCAKFSVQKANWNNHIWVIFLVGHLWKPWRPTINWCKKLVTNFYTVKYVWNPTKVQKHWHVYTHSVPTVYNSTWIRKTRALGIPYTTDMLHVLSVASGRKYRQVAWDVYLTTFCWLTLRKWLTGGSHWKYHRVRFVTPLDQEVTMLVPSVLIVPSCCAKRVLICTWQQRWLNIIALLTLKARKTSSARSTPTKLLDSTASPAMLVYVLCVLFKNIETMKYVHSAKDTQSINLP